MKLPRLLASTNFRWLLVALVSAALGAALTLLLHQPAPIAPAAPPVASPITAAPTITPAPLAPAPANDQATLVLELFNPSDISLTHQLSETAINQQIEQVLTTSFILTQCKLISEADYADSFRALIVFAQRMKLASGATAAEAKVREIAESASTSYSLVYSRTKCDSAQLPMLREQLLTWQKAMLETPSN